MEKRPHVKPDSRYNGVKETAAVATDALIQVFGSIGSIAFGKLSPITPKAEQQKSTQKKEETK